MKLQKTVIVGKPLDAVFGYLAEFVPGQRIRLRGENKTVIAIDTLTFRPVASGTEVTYAAEFTFKGPSRIVAPLLKPAFERLGNEAEAGMRKALDRL